MRMISNKLCVAVAVLLLAACPTKAEGGQKAEGLPYSSFRDVPGVTDREIRAIEALQKRFVFAYGMQSSTEAFRNAQGEVRGYSALFCEWLSGMFGIRFAPAIYEWDELLAGLESGGIDFTGRLKATEERRKTYFMTDTIAERSVKLMRIAGREALAEIAVSRLPRYAFLYGSASLDEVAPLSELPFETVFVNDYKAAYDALKSGQADAFFDDDSAEAAFDIYGDVVAEDFFPLIYVPISLSAKDQALEPIISVVQKVLQAGNRDYFAVLYAQGRQEYMKHKLHTRLTDEEKAYLRDHSVIPFGVQFDNYPVSFYNANEKEWQGIFFDVLREVEMLTGLSFERKNDQMLEFPVLFNMLENGEVFLLPDLRRTKDREGRFVWPETNILTDSYALISRADKRNLSLNDIWNERVGFSRDTAYEALFKRWYPGHARTVGYGSMDDAFRALERGEVDLVMASEHWLISLANYLEITGYKANVVFDRTSGSVFGFNKDQAVLCSIVDKAMRMIDVKRIYGTWVNKTYDYQARMALEQRRWLVGASVLLLCVLALLLVLFWRKRYEGILLEDLARKRTAELEAVTEQLRRSHESSQILLDSMPLTGNLWDKDGNILEFNKAALRLFKIKNKQYYLDNFFKLSPEYQPDGGRSDEKGKMFVQKAFDEGRCVFEWVHQTADGEPIPCEIILVRVNLGDQELVAGYARDLREHKRMIREIEQRTEEALSASRAKSDFLASMSHEMRTPMNAILGIAEIQLQDGSLSLPIREALDKIYNSGDLLLSIINDILDLSKIEAGKLELAPAEYQVASLINDIVTLNMMRISSRPIEFELSVDENAPTALYGDELRIKQILSNLLSNAFKYTNEGSVKLSVYTEPPVSGEAGGAGAMLVFVVSDTGQGMTEEEIGKLFDEYARFNMEANRSTEGTGLGMSITRNLIRMMNGEILVKSELNKGSVFTVRLPQGFAGSGVLGRELAESLEKFQLTGTRQIKRVQVLFEPMPYGRVLVVDDVESNLYVAKGLLAPYGLNVETVVSGFGAIGKIKNGNVYDIVFMDHMMPKMDGIEATKIIRGLGYAHPVVALTANAVVGQSEIFLANGFDGFISKPIDIRQLNSILKQFVRDKQPAEVIEAARRQNEDGRVEHIADGTARPVAGSPLAEIFVRDALKAAATLEALHEKRGAYEDMRTYVISVHGMKSALANIGEPELSAAAHRLEQAGREQNIAVIAAETPAFLGMLRTIIEKLTPQKEESEDSAAADEYADQDREYLREQMFAVQEACSIFDKKAAKAVLGELREKRLARSTGELLGRMADHLLHGDFGEVSRIAGNIIETL
ncbi:MAG: transporter substrate-binding domain-containing protein [Desulfovibrionaceae bacterium]|nr:transporter substrate-binding domain-containing protein [Desulfovibrionaceae bacterium]